MLSKTIEQALNDQITFEFYSEYLYLAMASYCDSIDLGGFANWLIAQAEEEHTHALRLFRFVQSREGKVELGALEKPKGAYKDVVELFESVLEHERKVTSRINAIYELALKEKDYPTQVEMEWFITEQVEEEKNVSDILKQIRWVKDNPMGLFMLDQQLGQRQTTNLPAGE
ncbi:ferritin [candidate division KSB1 bacterium]|jgi:ferritin|nr:MAG: ferritin [candidate division KSB1 bacterium]